MNAAETVSTADMVIVIYIIASYVIALIVAPIVWAFLSKESREDGETGVNFAICIFIAPVTPFLAVICGLFGAYVYLFLWCGGKLRPKPKPARPPGLSDEAWLTKMKKDVAGFEAKCMKAAEEERESDEV